MSIEFHNQFPNGVKIVPLTMQDYLKSEEKEFEERFDNDDFPFPDTALRDSVIDWLRSHDKRVLAEVAKDLEQKVDKVLREKLMEELPPLLENARKDERAKVVEMVESKKQRSLCRDCYEESQENESWNNEIYHEDESEYNQALDDLLTSLQGECEHKGKMARGHETIELDNEGKCLHCEEQILDKGE